MCWGGGAGGAGSQNNCLPLFLICAEDPTGHHINKIEKRWPKEKRRTSPPRASHLHTLQLDSCTWHYEGYGRVDSPSFRGKNKAPGREELAMGRQMGSSEGRTLQLRAVELPSS